VTTSSNHYKNQDGDEVAFSHEIKKYISE